MSSINTKKQQKSFLVPIVSLVVLSILFVGTMVTYVNINIFNKHLEHHIEKKQENYLKEYKDKIYTSVHLANDAIINNISKIESNLKISLKERIETALEVANFIYNKQKDKLSKEEIKKKVANYLSAIRFNDKRGYYFTYDFKTNIIYGHALDKFIGKDMSNFRDKKGSHLVKEYKENMSKNKIAFTKAYFSKPNDPDNQYPKLLCTARFEPLDIVFGTGEYLDVVEKETQQLIFSQFSNIEIFNNNYLFILDLHNIQGGENFATMILNQNRVDLVGKKLNDNYKDINGFEFRKDYLKNIRNSAEGYTRYWCMNPNTDVSKSKMTYFYLQKDWNWIIGSSFYFDDLDKQIVLMKKNAKKDIANMIKQSVVLVVFLMIVTIVSGVFLSYRINRTIKTYADEIIETQEQLQEREAMMFQQSKMASMGGDVIKYCSSMETAAFSNISKCKRYETSKRV